MNWGELKTLVKDRLRFDNEANVDLTTITVGSTFDTRCALYLQSFMEYTYAQYADRATLTLATNDREVNLLDAAKCSSAIWYPRLVWVNGNFLYESSVNDLLNLDYSASLTAGVPVAWAKGNHGYIMFNVPCASGYSSSRVSGFCYHAALSADNVSILLPNRAMDPLAAWICASMRGPVVSSEASMVRLERDDKESAGFIRRFAAQNKMKFMG